MSETFWACINAGSASSASVDVVMRIVLEWVCCDGEVQRGSQKKRAVVWIVCVGSRQSMRCWLCVVVDTSNRKVNKLRSFAPSFCTVEFCSCSLDNDFSAALVSRWRTLVSWWIN